MHVHVENVKSSMFGDACDQVRQRLQNVCEDVRKTMLDRADGVYTNMQRDYMSIIGGVSVGRVSMPREERSIRRQLDEMITEADTHFQGIIDCKDPTELESRALEDVDDHMEEDLDDHMENDEEQSDAESDEEDMEVKEEDQEQNKGKDEIVIKHETDVDGDYEESKSDLGEALHSVVQGGVPASEDGDGEEGGS